MSSFRSKKLDSTAKKNEICFCIIKTAMSCVRMIIIKSEGSVFGGSAPYGEIYDVVVVVQGLGTNFDQISFTVR